MKLLYIITGLGMGGAEKVVTSLADQLVDRGYTIKIVYLYGEKIVLPSNSTIEIEKIDIKKGLSFFSQLFTCVKTFSPSIVHSHMFHANIVARLLRLRFPKLKVINTAHSSNEGGKLRTFIYRLTNPLCHYFTNVSDSAVDAFIKQGIVKKGKIHCIPNSVDVKKFIRKADKLDLLRTIHKIKEIDNILLTVGSLREAKDYPTLVKTAEKLKQNGIHFIWLVIGEGPQKDWLENIVIEKNLQKEIKLLGRIDNITDYLNLANYLVVTSRWEGFGLAAAEAMACETLVISTKCGGVTEVMGGIGFTSPVGDYDSLAKTINLALQLPAEERRKSEQEARLRVINEYSMDSVLNRWDNIYNNLED